MKPINSINIIQPAPAESCEPPANSLKPMSWKPMNVAKTILFHIGFNSVDNSPIKIAIIIRANGVKFIPQGA